MTPTKSLRIRACSEGVSGAGKIWTGGRGDETEGVDAVCSHVSFTPPHLSLCSSLASFLVSVRIDQSASLSVPVK